MIEKIYLFDTEKTHQNLLPLSFTRPVADFRVGIVTIKEKWEDMFPGSYCYLPVEYLREKFCNSLCKDEDSLFICGTLLPDEEICEFISTLKPGDVVIDGEEPIVFRGSFESFENRCWGHIYNKVWRRIKYVFDIFLENSIEIKKDFYRITKERSSQPLPDCTRVIGELEDADGYPQLFIEKGAQIECISVNLKNGPVYIGEGAVVMEGSCLRGPLAICDHTEIRMGAKVYGGTTFGPHCKIGGEIDNTVIFGYTNKAHDGYLGNAVIGEWCNIGAGVNASNLKNDYSKIRIWNYYERKFIRTDLQFCGLIMGDHSKIGINCMLNTATVIGVGVNLHGCGYPRAFIPSFCEGSPGSGFSDVPLTKFHEIMERVFNRRTFILTSEDKKIFEKIYNIATEFKHTR